VLTWVIAIAVTNLALGYGLAVTLRADFQLPRFRMPRFKRPLASAVKSEAPERPESQDTPAVSVVTTSIADTPNFQAKTPPAWITALAREGITANSLIEAAAQMMRLEVARYRKELVTLENMTRDASGPQLGQTFEQICNRLGRVNTAWMLAQREASDALHASKDSFGEFQEIGEGLEAVLHDQAAQIEATTSALGQLAIAQEAELSRQRLAGELGRLLDLAHRLRDRMQDAIGTILAFEGRLESIEAALRNDMATGCVSRLGLEAIYYDWQQHDDARQLCVGVVDADRFARVTATLGASAGDEILRELANVLQNSIRTDRGFDRVCRIGGTTFLMFYGFTGPRSANSSLERVRQSIEATSFHIGEKSFDLTVSGAVVEAQPKEKLPDLLKRALRAVTEAKRKGRNRIALDEGSGPTFPEAPQFQVTGQVIEVDNATAS
jgi:diguanylate cyclase (GGDEF)-like protein